MAEAAAPEDPGGGKKKSGLMATIAVVSVLTALGGGGGWVLGGMFGPQMQPPGEKQSQAPKAKEEAAAQESGKARKEDEGLEHISTEENNVVQLEPITANLAFPTDSWIRLEVALLFKGKPDVTLAENVHQDIAAYLRTVTMQQIEGPRGFLYLKEDLEDRADLITEGKVAKIMFRTFVIE